jgi:hypothetical protein
MHHRTSLRALVVAVLTAVIFVGASGVASAAPGPVDDSSYSAAQKATAETKAAAVTAKRTCQLVLVGPLGSFQRQCEEVMSSQFTREKVPLLAATTLCAAIPVPAMFKLGCLAVAATQKDKIAGWFWDAYKVALGAAETVVAVVSFIANPARALEFFANDLKSDAVGLFTDVMTQVTTVSSFDASATWWRTAYAATAGIGVAVLAGMILLTLCQSSTGKIGPEETGRSLGHSVIAVLMMFMGPPVASLIASVADGMSTGIIAWMGPDVVGFLAKATAFTALTSHMSGGLAMGLLIFGALFIAAFGVLGTFIVQTVSTYILGTVIGLAWGMTGNPKWRKKAMRLPTVWVGLVLAKPAMLLVLGVVAKMANSIDLAPHSGQGLKALINALIIVVALLTIAFAPWSLLKWFPLLPDGSDSSTSSGPVGAHAAVGAAGSTANTMAMTRARNASNQTSNRSSSPSASKAPAPASRTGPSQAAAPTARAGRAGTSAAGASKTATASGGKAAASGGKAAAAGAGKAAAGVGAGAATGGALLIAQLAAQAGQAAMTKAREAAAAATPEIRGDE